MKNKIHNSKGRWGPVLFLCYFYLACKIQKVGAHGHTDLIRSKAGQCACKLPLANDSLMLICIEGSRGTSQLHVTSNHSKRSSVYKVHFIKIFKKYTYYCIHVDKLVPLFFKWFQNQSTSCKKRCIQIFVYFYCFIFDVVSVTACSVDTIYKKCPGH